MAQDDRKSTGGAAETPIETFSNCHVGILAHLDTLAELPYLAAAAARARSTAAVLLSFFEDAVLPHHAEEEGDLFPAVLASAKAGDERIHVQAVVGQLTREHSRDRSGLVEAEACAEGDRQGSGRRARRLPVLLEPRGAMSYSGAGHAASGQPLR